MHLTKLVLALAVTAAVCPAGVIFSNTTTDAQDSAFYSASGVTQIGDRLQLASAAALTSLDAQFFNAGSDTTFDAVLRFYDSGNPVGSQIGGPFTTTSIFIASGTSQTVTFSNLGNLLVPQDLVLTFSAENVSGGGDIGVNFFDPPTVGTSSESFFIVYDGSNFAQASTNLEHDNIYLQIDGTALSPAPEPSTASLFAGALAVLACGSMARRVRRRYGQ